MPKFLSIGSSLRQKWFANVNFQAFVIDFYATLWIGDETESINNIFEAIFWNSEIYRQFLKYCRENNCSFVESQENKHINVAIFLLAFEQAKLYIELWVKNNIWEILGLGDSILEIEFANEIIPETDVSFLHWLIHSAYRNNMVNDKWEVVYYLCEKYGFQMVYSRASWIHYIDKNWVIIDLIETNKRERIEALQDVKENFIDVLLVNQTDFSNDDATRLIELRTEFSDDTKTSFWSSHIQELHFRSWVWGKYRESLLMLQDIQAEDVRRVVLDIVETDDMWEFEDTQAQNSTVQKRRNTFKVVK